MTTGFMSADGFQTFDVDVRDDPSLEPGPSETPKAAPAEPEPARQSPIATCPVDGDPLVMTLVFSGQEFICLECGRLYPFFGPTPAEATPQLLERMEQRRAEFLPLARAILTPGARRDGCDRCAAGEDHVDHATDDERAASDAALELVNTIRQRRRDLHR